MARRKAREQYAAGSVSVVWTDKLDKDGNVVWTDKLDKDGNVVVGEDGTPEKVKARVQLHDRDQKPVWRICVTIGTEEYVDEAGRLRKRQRKVQRTFHGTLKEAREKRDELAETYEQVDVSRTADTFSALVDAWSRSDDLGCSDRQRKQYLRLLGYVAPYLDAKPLVELRKADVNAAIEKASVRPDGRKVAPSSIKKLSTVMRRVFEWGIDEEYIVQNPCRSKRRRSGGSHQQASAPQRRSLSAEEAAMLRARLDEAEEEAYQAFAEKERRQADRNNTFGRALVRDLSVLSNLLAVRLMLATGVRRGEALGLTWGNLRLDEGVVRVAQTLNDAMEVRAPKTDNGIRNLYLDRYTLDHLRKWKEFQASVLGLIYVDGVALAQDGNTPVFCSDNGGWIDPTNCYRWWSRYREEAGVGGLLLHELRHSQVTLLMSNGVPWEMVQARIGHSRPSSVTLTYLHEMPANDMLAAEVMGRLLYEADVPEGIVVSMLRTA